MWSVDYVQVPDDQVPNPINTKSEPPKSPKSPKLNESVSRPSSIHHKLVKQINVSSISSLGK